MINTGKFISFLTDIRSVNPFLVESIMEAFTAIYTESTKDLVEDIKNNFNRLGGVVNSEDIHKLGKQDRTDLFLYGKSNGYPDMPMRKSDASPYVDFLSYGVKQPELAGLVATALQRTVENRPELNKQLKVALNAFITGDLDINQLQSEVASVTEVLNETPEEASDDYGKSLNKPDVLEQEEVGGVYNEEELDQENNAFGDTNDVGDVDLEDFNLDEDGLNELSEEELENLTASL